MYYPWEDVIPQTDIDSFRAEGYRRPIQAGTQPAVVIVDMTRAFIDSRYPTGWSDTGYPALEANRQLLIACREAQIPIFFTKAYPTPDYPFTPAQKGRWKNFQTTADPSLPPGDVIPDEIAPLPGEVVIDKQGKPSGFFGTPLVSLLIHAGVDTVIVTGMTTSGCVRATALDAFMYNFHVIIPHECSADRSQLSHKVNLFDMHMKYLDVASLEDTIAYIQQVTGRVPAMAQG